MRTIKKSNLDRFSLRGPRPSVALAVLALFLAGYTQLSMAGHSTQSTFKSAEEASQALFAAVQNDDERAVTDILGAQNELVSSDDEAQDKLDRERFAQKYRQMHRLVRATHGDMLLYIGAENWPFPIPLVSRNGAWRFDADAGGQEIQYRRIGENEVTAIARCHDLAAAARPPLADAKSDNKPVPLHGYYFRVLPQSGSGVTTIAYPAVYRSSGVMTFIINKDGVVREKDLGPNTAKIARAMAKYHADRTWTRAETP